LPGAVLLGHLLWVSEPPEEPGKSTPNPAHELRRNDRELVLAGTTRRESDGARQNGY
jgi:hypothetical protein